MPFLYGNHVLKAHLGRITEDTPEHQGVVVYSMNDIPLVIGLCVSYKLSSSVLFAQGFGVTSKSTVDTRKTDPTAIVVFHQAYVCKLFTDLSAQAFFSPRDVGEYLRDEVNRFSRDHRPPTQILLAGYVVLISVLPVPLHVPKILAASLLRNSVGVLWESCFTHLVATVHSTLYFTSSL